MEEEWDWRKQEIFIALLSILLIQILFMLLLLEILMAIHPERGVFKTTDGGETWTKILYTNDTSGCADLVMDPSNPNRLIGKYVAASPYAVGF